MVLEKLKKLFKKKNASPPVMEKFAFPLVKQVFPSLVSKTFVSVQPMNAPSGIIFTGGSSYQTQSNGYASSGYSPRGYGTIHNQKDFDSDLIREILVNINKIKQVLIE